MKGATPLSAVVRTSNQMNNDQQRALPPLTNIADASPFFRTVANVLDNRNSLVTEPRKSSLVTEPRKSPSTRMIRRSAHRVRALNAQVLAKHRTRLSEHKLTHIVHFNTSIIINVTKNSAYECSLLMEKRTPMPPRSLKMTIADLRTITNVDFYQ